MIIERLFALTVISIFEVISRHVLPLVPFNDWYFAACGAFNLFMLVIFIFTEKSKLMKDLVLLLTVQFMLQLTGWTIYRMHPESYFYDWSILTIVTITYVRIFLTGRYDRDYTDCTIRTFKYYKNYISGLLFSCNVSSGVEFTQWVSK